MELGFSSTLLLVFFFLFMIATILKGKKAKNTTVKLPPGPWQLPLIGNLHQIISPLPHQKLRSLANKYGPLMWLNMGEVPTIIVSSPEIAKEVLKAHDAKVSQRPSRLFARIISYDCTNLIFAPHGNFWKQIRKICMMELLSTSRVRSFQPIREQEVSALIRTMLMNEGSSVNVSEKIFSLTCGITARAAFGRKNKDEKEFIRIVFEISKLANGFCLVDMYPSIKFFNLLSATRYKLEKLHQASDKILENIVQEHKERRSLQTSNTSNEHVEEDLVDVLLKLQQNGNLDFPLTNDNIKAIIQDIFAAGSETSSTTVEWAMSEMIKNPRVMKKAQDEARRVFNERGRVDESGIHELEYLSLVVKETLRLHPSVPLLQRECSEDCVIDGYEVPARTNVIVNAWAIGRDPRHWKEAEKFHPERFLDTSIDFRGLDFELIPFGAGRRICPGISFALPNILLPLAQLLYHFDWELPNGMKHQDLDMTEEFGITVTRRNDLFLIPISHHHIPSEETMLYY
ncbi:Cytochrome P450 71D10, putative [Theobroma cacao]|uniref:Cytochrome P450 71D10, putative n=1 Tax=Theobroma cacao TaxID=3641 RepID=A0A061F5W6_THECC|nr:Cytochrome P450 71D10, putative [Theobroma cacao]